MEVFRIILGEQGANLWRAIALNNNVIQTQSGCEFATITTRNSGEQTTSLTNTLLNQVLINYHAKIHNQVVGEDFHYFVEGDDMILGFNDKSIWSQLRGTYNSVGFQTTVEHEGTFEGSSFCKVIFGKDSDGNYVGYRRPDHALMKIGFTSKAIRAKDSILARSLLFAKIKSLECMF